MNEQFQNEDTEFILDENSQVFTFLLLVAIVFPPLSFSLLILVPVSVLPILVTALSGILGFRSFHFSLFFVFTSVFALLHFLAVFFFIQ